MSTFYTKTGRVGGYRISSRIVFRFKDADATIAIIRLNVTRKGGRISGRGKEKSYGYGVECLKLQVLT